MIEQLKQDLIFEEGFISNAYQDHLGFWTIGVGRLIDKKKGGGITYEEAMFLLENDIKQKSKDLFKALPWLKNKPENIQRALLNMAFQMGVNGVLNFKTTLGFIKKGEYEAAAYSAMQSKWASQTPARAKRVTDLIKYDITKEV
jgi:lysozyme